ncbi:hypothetical protein JTB14_008405 [Gonioctena quinquepunctata]|nr:hypothetical protein JTB14_008405 [Gonioctena quinquepunctata]
MGHVGLSSMEKLKTLVHGIDSDLKVASDFVCKSCALGKSRRLPFVKSSSGSTRILDLLYLTSKAYRLFDVEKHAVFTSRDIIFSETEKGSSLLKKTGDTSRNAIFFPDSSETDNIFAENDSSDATGNFSPVDSESADFSIVTRVESDSDYIPPETVDVENENLRRGTRDKRPPIYLQDYDLNFVLTVLSDDPVTVDDALSRPEQEEWRKAMDREYKAQLDNGTWELVDLPPGRKPLKCKKILTKLLNSAKANYFKNLFTIHKNDPRQTWETIKHATNEIEGKQSITRIIGEDNKDYLHEKDIAQEFNKYSSSVGRKLASKIKTPKNVTPNLTKATDSAKLFCHYEGDTDKYGKRQGNLLMPEDSFVDYVSWMEKILMENVKSVATGKTGEQLHGKLKEIPFVHPCSDFPYNYLFE